ncbi:TraV family lipoprotein [Asticcacaulis sp. W401b]|uniref:TraV family lipoprotein n=1 Tax=Asticcacaulis sp. W401b TaxID=3388666 RepID=UPI0039708E34
MFRGLALIVLPFVLTACASNNTSTKWTCIAEGDHCTSIAETDARQDKTRKISGDAVIFDTKPARWWEPNAPGTATREFDPRRDGDQVMRVVVAPFVDAQGDYHARSEIFAVVRRAQWWLTPPVAKTAAPDPGAELSPETKDKARP